MTERDPFAPLSAKGDRQKREESSFFAKPPKRAVKPPKPPHGLKWGKPARREPKP